MSNMISYITLFLLMVLSFYFSLTETAFTALNRIRIKSMIEDMPSTINGWIVHMLGKIPENNDSFKYENLTVAVSKVEHRRALECIVTVGNIIKTM